MSIGLNSKLLMLHIQSRNTRRKTGMFQDSVFCFMTCHQRECSTTAAYKFLVRACCEYEPNEEQLYSPYFVFHSSVCFCECVFCILLLSCSAWARLRLFMPLQIFEKLIHVNCHYKFIYFLLLPSLVIFTFSLYLSVTWCVCEQRKC